MSDWQTVGVNSAESLSLAVHRLKPGTQYQFLVLARNVDTGTALFSSPVSAATAGPAGIVKDLVNAYVTLKFTALTR